MLLIASIMMGIFSFISLGHIDAQAYSFNITALGIFREGIATSPEEATDMGTIYLFVVSLLSCILPLIGIFCFKNMKLQKNLIIITILCTVTVAALVSFEASKFASDFKSSVNWSVCIASPLIALAANLIAHRMICSDQKKLRAADRIR